jgi:hypothetical protein
MPRHVWNLLRNGWRIITEAHTIFWLVEKLGIILAPSVLITAALRFYGEHSLAVLTVAFSSLLTLCFLLLLAWLGAKRPSISSDVDDPRTEAITERRYEIVRDVIAHLADVSEWGERLRASPPNAAGMRPHPRFAAIDELVRAGRDGEIDIFGRLDRTGEHQTISQQYWLYASIDPGSVFGAGHSAVTIPTSQSRQERERFVPYDGLCVDRATMLRLWPTGKSREPLTGI